MKNGINEFWKAAEEIFPESRDLIAKTMREVEGAAIPAAPATSKNCRTWRDAWLYSFKRADLDATDFLRLKNGRILCVVWIGTDFNDKLVDLMLKIAKRLGPDSDLVELCLIGTNTSEGALQRLKAFLPNAIITKYSEEEQDRNPRLGYADAAKGKEMFPE